MILDYNNQNLFTVFYGGRKDFFHLKPGINIVPNNVYEKALKNKRTADDIKNKMDSGLIVQVSDLEDDVNKPAIVKIKSIEQTEKIIKRTYDPYMLQEWLENESRVKIKRTIKSQIELIKKRTFRDMKKDDE